MNCSLTQTVYCIDSTSKVSIECTVIFCVTAQCGQILRFENYTLMNVKKQRLRVVYELLAY